MPISTNGEATGRYKGNKFLDAGYNWAPYIPLTRTPVVMQNQRVIISDDCFDEQETLPDIDKPNMRSIDDDWCDQVTT